jgi:glycosyltransferase involved in cell wall biosynthesis/GT2 family glycosyltransferase
VEKHGGKSSIPTKVLLVSPEYPGLTPSGGIGTALKALAEHLGEVGFDVTYLIPTFEPLEVLNSELGNGIRNHTIVNIPISKYSWIDTIAARSYGVFRWIYDLLETDRDPIVVHFPEYQGMGFYTIEAKVTIPIFNNLTIVVQTHGPTEWTLELNSTPISSSQLNLQVHMEKECIRGADYIVSPSEYMLNWLRTRNYLFNEDRVRVLKNLPGKDLENYQKLNRRRSATRTEMREIIYFGRHEERKGFRKFLEAISSIEDLISASDCSVTFVGPLGTLEGVPSILLVCEESKKWNFEVHLVSHLDRSKALEFLGSKKNSLIVIPSVEENLPYTVYEIAALGLPLISSSEGGGKELLAETDIASVFPMTKENISNAIETAISEGINHSSLGFDFYELKNKWNTFHQNLFASNLNQETQLDKSLTVVITHFERPEELLATLIGFLNQSDQDFDLVVVDDCSSSGKSIEALKGIRRLVESAGWTFIRNDRNSYLGASRNNAFNLVKTSHVVFFDDDDRPDPNFVKSIFESISDDETIVIPLNITKDEFANSEIPIDELLNSKISYLPTRGPLINAVLENNYGSSVSVIPRKIFEKIGGYSEEKGVGHEDYEFYLKASIAGVKFRILPLPIYVYRPTALGMISTTNGYLNFNRTLQHFLGNETKDIARDFLFQNVMAKAKENTENRQMYITQRKYGQTYWMAKNLGRGESVNEVVGFLTSVSDNAPLMKVASEWLEKLATKESRNFEQEVFPASNDLSPLTTSELSYLSNLVSEIVISAVQNTKFQANESPTYISALVSRMTENECARICKTLELLNMVQVASEDSLQSTYSWLTILAAGSMTINESTRTARFKFADSFGKSLILMETVINDASSYISSNHDLAEIGGLFEQINHFVANGRREERDGFKETVFLMAMIAQFEKESVFDVLSQKLSVPKELLEHLMSPPKQIAPLKQKAKSVIGNAKYRNRRKP